MQLITFASLSSLLYERFHRLCEILLLPEGGLIVENDVPLISFAAISGSIIDLLINGRLCQLQLLRLCYYSFDWSKDFQRFLSYDVAIRT